MLITGRRALLQAVVQALPAHGLLPQLGERLEPRRVVVEGGEEEEGEEAVQLPQCLECMLRNVYERLRIIAYAVCNCYFLRSCRRKDR